MGVKNSTINNIPPSTPAEQHQPDSKDKHLQQPIQEPSTFSQIQTSDICVSNIIVEQQLKECQQQNLLEKNQQQQIKCQQISQKCDQISQKIVQIPKQINQGMGINLGLININLQQQTGNSKKALSSFRQSEMQYDPIQAKQIQKQILANFIPAIEIKQIKLQENKRILILWLKSNHSSEREKERDKTLIRQGFKVYSHDNIQQIFKKYQQQQQQHLRLSILLIFSFSESYNNEQTIKQLYQQLIQTGKIKILIIVKPPQIQNYRMHLNKINVNKKVLEISYPIQGIRLKLADIQISQFYNSCNFLPLHYWAGRQGLSELINQQDQYKAMLVKAKVNLFGFLNIGKLIIERISEHTDTFKRLTYQYTTFHEKYLGSSSLLKIQQKDESYLKKIGLKLIEDPISFYCERTHGILIDRLIKLNADKLQHISHIILPISLVFYKIRQQYRRQSELKKYKNQFLCYYQLYLNQIELQQLKIGTVFQNLGFLKAKLRPYISNEQSNGNTELIINITSKKLDGQLDNGYCFWNTSKTHSQQIKLNQKQNKYFKGFDCVIFNLLNSFRVVSKRYDLYKKKNILQIQYGYIARQQQLQNLQNFIPESEQWRTYSPISQKYSIPLDYSSLIKHSSNLHLLGSIRDFGDCLSLTHQHVQAIRYYDQLFICNKSVMKSNALLLIQLQEKKGLNYALAGNSKSALDYLYHSFSYIHRGSITPELEGIYLKTMELQLKGKQFDKLIRFNQNIIKNAQIQPNISHYSNQFLLELHQYLVRAFFQNTVEEYEVVASQARITQHTQICLQVIQQIGEYNERVADFYRELGRCRLISQSPLEGLAYLNKALLILKSIYTQYHPFLCLVYQYLAVGYVQMHDYKQALKQICQAILIFDIYFSKEDERFVSCFQLKGKIQLLLNKIQESRMTFQQQISMLQKLRKAELISNNKKINLVTSDYIAIYNTFEQKQLQTLFDPRFRPSRTTMSSTYCYMYIAYLSALQYNYSEAVSILETALDISKVQFGQDTQISVQIGMLICHNYIEMLNWKQALNKSKIALRAISKNKLQNKYEGMKYQQVIGDIHDCNHNPAQAYKCYSKAREIAFKVIGQQTPTFCILVDNLAKYSLKHNKIQEATNYFSESSTIRIALLQEATINRSQVRLYDADFQNYIRSIKLGLICSQQNNAFIHLANNQLQQAKSCLKKCIQSANDLVGEFHVYTASLHQELGKVYLQNDKTILQALTCFNFALSVYKSLPHAPAMTLVEVYEGIAKAQQARNQLGQCMEQRGKMIKLFKKAKKIGKQYQICVFNFKRIVQLILKHENPGYLKIAYYIISNAFEQEKDEFLGQQVVNLQKYNKIHQNKYLKQNIRDILLLANILRDKIQIDLIKNAQFKKIQDEIDYYQDRNGIIMQNIRKNYQIRRQKRSAGIGC